MNHLSLALTTSPSVVSPLLLIILCVLAGIGTVMLLPGAREKVIHKIGGTLVLVAAIVLASTLIHYAAASQDSMGVYFWVFAAIAIYASLRVVTHTRPVYSAMYFVLTVFASAGLFVLLWAEFMAAALILIYAGAILVTYVFVIMLAARAGSGGELSEADQVSREPLAASAVGFGLMAMLLYVIFDKAPVAAAPSAAAAPPDVGVSAFGQYLFANQLVNLELAGLLLTLAMVGAIVIARRRMWVAIPGKEAVYRYVIGDDNPHDLPIEGTSDLRQKAYPET
jgi:NADH-quinone oxidoreductase subunit J